MCGKRNLTCETGGESEKGRILRIEALWQYEGAFISETLTCPEVSYRWRRRTWVVT